MRQATFFSSQDLSPRFARIEMKLERERMELAFKKKMDPEQVDFWKKGKQVFELDIIIIIIIIKVNGT